MLNQFEDLHANPLPKEVFTLETSEPRARGRSEERYFKAAPVPPQLIGKGNWTGLKSLIQTTTTIKYADKTITDSRDLLSSLAPSLKSLRKQAGWSTTILANIVTQRP